MKFFRNFDFIVLFAVFIIVIFGLVMIWSLTPLLFPQQLLFCVVGFVFFFTFSRIDFRVFQSLSKFLYLGSILFLISTFVFGEVTRGSTRWIQIGNFTIQPSELVKPFLVLFFASLFADQEETKRSFLVKGLIFLFFPLFFVFKQPDLGSTLVIFMLFVGMVIGLGLARRQIISIAAASLLIVPTFWFFLKDYQRNRILSFLDPYLDPLGSGYNLIQAVITVGSGQIFGRGLGRGTQSHLFFLPERHTDFIFASFSEEFGFVGAAVLIVLYFIILYRILTIAKNSSSLFGSFIAIGVFSMLSFQIFVNIGMNLGILPITGITLPLVSYGGSSILATMISLGLVEAVANFRKSDDTLEIR